VADNKVFKPLVEYIRDANEERKRLLEETRGVGPSWGISKLDEITGGIRRGWHVLQGPGGIGKSTLLTYIMLRFMRDPMARGWRLYFAEYEMPPLQFSEILVSALSGATRRDIFMGDPDAMRDAIAAVESSNGGEVLIVSEDMPVEAALDVYLNDDHGMVFLVDYLQLATSSLAANDQWERMRQITRIMQRAGRKKALVTVSSENKDGNVWGDRQAFYHATLLMRMQRTDEPIIGRNKGSILELDIKKNRIGPIPDEPIRIVANFANGTIDDNATVTIDLNDPEYIDW